jgi:hypothetical protein
MICLTAERPSGERFYLDAGSDECPPAEHVTAWASEHGLIPAYAYLAMSPIQ